MKKFLKNSCCQQYVVQRYLKMIKQLYNSEFFYSTNLPKLKHYHSLSVCLCNECLYLNCIKLYCQLTKKNLPFATARMQGVPLQRVISAICFSSYNYERNLLKMGSSQEIQSSIITHRCRSFQCLALLSSFFKMIQLLLQI